MIAANIGEIAELIDQSRTGLFLHPGHPEDLAAQVKEVLTHPSKLATMRRAARGEFEAKTHRAELPDVDRYLPISDREF